MIWAVLVATVFVVAVFGGLLALHLSMVNRLRDDYERRLHELEEHPADPGAWAAAESAGRSYYRFLRIKEHATLSDFPLPYFEAPDLDEDLVERDIEARTGHHRPAA